MSIRIAQLACALVALLATREAVAQDHAHHQMPAPPAKEATEKVDHSKMDHSKMDHSKMDHSKMDHSKMDHSAMGHDTAVADTPLTPIPVLTDADRAAAKPPAHAHPAHDNTIQSMVVFNRLEGFDSDEGTGFAWEGQAWIGTDLNKLWLRTEGERVSAHTASANVEVLYGRAIAPWWDLVAGVRHDDHPNGSQDFAAIGIMGVAPYKFEVGATAYIGQAGQTALELEAEYDVLLSNRLILQPMVSLNLYGKDDVRRGIGSGLSSAEAGLRLRYAFTRQFAPYVGVVRHWTFGRTADLHRSNGERINDTQVVAGVRVWF